MSGKTTPLSDSQKSKSEVIQDLGFSPKQVERFEILANNKELVELEKATAREENGVMQVELAEMTDTMSSFIHIRVIGAAQQVIDGTVEVVGQYVKLNG